MDYGNDPLTGSTGQHILARVIARLNDYDTDEGFRAAALLWVLIEPVPVVTTVLGDSRSATYFYGNGDYACPFKCGAAICRSLGETTCKNPGCEAHPGLTPDTLQRLREKKRIEREVVATRQRNHEAALQRIRDDNVRRAEWRAAQRAECIRRGACLDCLFRLGYERVKFKKHRKGCPKARANA